MRNRITPRDVGQIKLRLTPEIRAAALARAHHERRSLNNWVEGLILSALEEREPAPNGNMLSNGLSEDRMGRRRDQ